MTEQRMPRGDPISELRFALAEADAEDTSERLRRRVLEASIDARAQGRPGEPAEHIDGAETLRRTVGVLDALLGRSRHGRVVPSGAA